ncbi:hemolysin family protein [Paraflavisolibacter sp. H34]|uniref:hemolysin family protein n=1 Tax=Huijunlia imazamoxiresistens TaxID=3127457 RepID=UPI0030182227
MIAVSTLVWFFVTIIMMGFFSGIEMAFYSANRFGIELKKKQGRPGAELLSRFFDNPEQFLGVSILGFTLFLVGFTLMFSLVMEPVWTWVGLLDPQYNTPRLVAEIILSTFIVLIFAEFLPRALFRAQSSIFLSRLIWLINIFYQLLQPLAASFINLANWMLKYVFNVRVNEKKEAFTRVDLGTLFQQSEDAKHEQEEVDTELFENVLELSKIKIRQCLVPRKEIIGLDSRIGIEEARQKFIETKLSKLVVFEGNIDNIVGYVHQLDMFKSPDSLQSILISIPAVPESMSAIDLMNKLTKERKSIAWVVDEFGGTSGIVTMEDVLEEIFGEIQDEYDSEEFVEKQISENEYIFSGRLELDYISKKYDLEFTNNESETLSGYIINYHETIPRQKDRIIIDDYEFDILSVSDTRIEMVKLKILK